MRGVDHREVVGAAQEHGPAPLEVVDGDQHGGVGVGEPRAAQPLLEHGPQAVVVVALVEVPVERRDPLEQRAVEDPRPLLDVQLGDPGGRERVRSRERASEDRAGRGAGYEVDQIADRAAGAALDLGQHERRDQPADPAAVEREDLHPAVTPVRLGSFSVPLMTSSGAFFFGLKPDFMPK
ncbi:MAG: hypothetical protein M3N56_03350 [Actinomycetota bacterium]|nr:hypothetical protein [Actinomycetota bacterium]